MSWHNLLKNPFLFILLLILSCTNQRESKMSFTGAEGEVKIITLDPGHFHAALVQKVMVDQVSPVVSVYAPDGPDVKDHLDRIHGFNSREINPTHWQEEVYTGIDFLEKMVKDRSGNVVVISGNNREKTKYIKSAVAAGFHVLADKPMCINKQGFELLRDVIISNEKNNVLLYDIMTERYEVTNILQKVLVHNPDIFGLHRIGSPDNPSVTKESVHHFFKYVSGNPVKRPAWYFDTSQQGEGLVDVTTHLVDLIQWVCFPRQIMDCSKDIKMIRARRWPTFITKKQFEKVTRLPEFPDFLISKLNNEGKLPVYANGEMVYRLKGIHAGVSVIWNFQAPEGGGDTHYSIMRGTKSNIVIRQGKKQRYRPELYVQVSDRNYEESVGMALKKALSDLQKTYTGLELERVDDEWHIVIPDICRVGHEAHFGQVMQKVLNFLVDGKLPEWEGPNMIAKYYTTTSALELALRTKTIVSEL